MDEEAMEKMMRENSPFGEDFSFGIPRSAPPPHTDSEAKSGQKKEGRNGNTQADKLVDFVLDDPEIQLFHNELKVPQVRLPIDEHHEIWPIGSSSFKLWLVKSFYDAHNKKTLTPNAVSTALQVIAARARLRLNGKK